MTVGLGPRPLIFTSKPSALLSLYIYRYVRYLLRASWSYILGLLFLQTRRFDLICEAAAAMCPTGSSLRQAAAVRSEFRPAFDVLDADRDGKISREDLRHFYAGFPDGMGGDDEAIRSMMQVADSNKDGFVEYDEFERLLDCRTSARNRGCVAGGVMEDVFKVMDRDGDGKVGVEDLKSYMKWAGFSATEEDIKAMIRLGGGDEHGGVSYDDLLKILAVDYVC